MGLKTKEKTMTNNIHTIDEFINIFEEAYNTGIDGIDKIRWSITWRGEKHAEVADKANSMFGRNQFVKQSYPVDYFVYAMRKAMRASMNTDGLTEVIWKLNYKGNTSSVSEVVRKMEEMNREIGMKVINAYVDIDI